MNIKLKCGLKGNLPSVAAAGEPLVTTDTQELYIGTGSGIAKISDIIVSETEPPINNDKLWLVPSTNIMRICINDVWELIENDTNTDFGGF
jgi:hypothetical protein